MRNQCTAFLTLGMLLILSVPTLGQLQTRVLPDRLLIKGINTSDQGSFFGYENISLVGSSPTAGAFEATPTSLALDDGIGNRGSFLAEPDQIRFQNFDNLLTNYWFIQHVQNPDDTRLQFRYEFSGGGVGLGIPLELTPTGVTLSGSVSMNSPLEIGSFIVGDNSFFIGVGAGSSVTGGFNLTGIGYQALRDNQSGAGENTAVGAYALQSNSDGDRNSALGSGALATNSTGNDNTAVGTFALQNNTIGAGNAALGVNALLNNTEGTNNIAIGNGAMTNNTDGTDNVAIGGGAMSGMETGFNNTAVGHMALASFISGGDNAAFGTQALFNSIGGGNTAMGSFSLPANTTGTFNTAVGYLASGSNTEGSFNTALGHGALNDVAATAYENATALGYDAEPGASNTIRLGNDAVTTIGGVVDFTVTSDARFKHKVKEDVPGIDFIQELRPVTYHLDGKAMDDWRTQHLGQQDFHDYAQRRDIEQIKFSGFLAQEVEKAAEKVGYDFSGVDKPDTDQQAYGLRYGSFVVPLVKATQEQQEEIKELKVEIRKQKSENENLRQELHELKELVQQLIDGQPKENESIMLNQAPSLDQNQPNPFTDQSRIGYFLPAGSSKAELIITAIDGRELQRVVLASTGKGTIQIQTQNLPAGTYNYSLVVDGQIVDTKRMVIQ